MEINLGYAEKTDSWKLKSKYFPSKIGGYPSWLSYESLPSEVDLQCEKCKKPLIFLCQVYAPIDSKEDSFHRTIFIFICQDGKCCSLNSSSNLQVFRCQLPRVNKYYSAIPPKEEEDTSADEADVRSFSRICRVCGSYGSKLCGHCKLVAYCSRDHQLLDWKTGHKSECKTKVVSSPMSNASKDLLFPEYEIDIEPEELENDTTLDCSTELKEKASVEDSSEHLGGEFNQDDLMKMAKKETDKEFSKFRERIKDYAEQVLRYERNGSPLLVSSENKPTNIPNCEHCGSKRIYEFQIMPQLLVYLNVDNVKESIDWGTIIVYTCEKSCSPNNYAYIKEICYKQDFSPE